MARYQPALLGGLFIGVLSVLPVIGWANCCCLWVILGGMLATYLEQQNTPTPIETSKAAVGGLIAGAIGGVIEALGSAVMFNALAPQDAMEQVLSTIPDMPPETLDMIQSIMTGPNLLLISLVLKVPLFAVFGMLGALLGTVFFRKKAMPGGGAGPLPQ
ncbi:MAG: hypothetical protein HQ485_09150 [Acidobacteria bacterium]|jgi:hypothetical protein|nr:hypothetical protein [Acidobacteriota bacterium]